MKITGMDKVGEKIRIQRLIKNYSQEYMAFELEISQGAYSNIERNATAISLERVFEIAEILEISAFDLMPKPRFGSGINQAFFAGAIIKLKKFWNSHIRNRITEPKKPLNGIGSDN